MPGLNQEVDVWVEGKELRRRRQGAKAAAGKAVAMTPRSRGDCARRVGVRVLGPRHDVLAGRELRVPGLPTLPGEAAMLIRGLSLFDELGFGGQARRRHRADRVRAPHDLGEPR